MAEIVSELVAGTEAQAKVEKPWQFKKGQSGNPGGKPKEPDPDGSRGVPELLKAMRRIARTEPKNDKTALQRRVRKQFDEDFTTFSRQLANMEAALLRGRQQVEPTPGPGAEESQVPDPGSERCLENIDKLLKEWGEPDHVVTT